MDIFLSLILYLEIIPFIPFISMAGDVKFQLKNMDFMVVDAPVSSGPADALDLLSAIYRKQEDPNADDDGWCSVS